MKETFAIPTLLCNAESIRRLFDYSKHVFVRSGRGIA